MQLMAALLDSGDYRMFLALPIVKLDLADLLDGESFCIGNPSSLKFIVNHIIHPDTDNANVLVSMSVLISISPPNK